MRGLSDEMDDRHYLLVDGIDGRTHYVPIGAAQGDGLEVADEGTGLTPGSVVEIRPTIAVVREVDRTIAAVAAANGGRYDADAHFRHDPAASEAFVEAHGRRLEAMRRKGGVAERDADGNWTIAPDHLERVEAFETRQLKNRPVEVALLSPVDVGELARADAATWLDRTLVASEALLLREAGFGRETSTALVQRRQWLMNEGLAEQMDGEIRYRKDMLAILRRRELLRIAGQLSRGLGLPFGEAAEGEGVYRRRVDLISGRFAVLERSRDFTLVPWRPVLERRIGQGGQG
ncbi:DUF3363 domain-containing protein [Sphingobium sp.]|uniref:DUF3363 domain-containing protein n=1 Tax=Sphingobium sp. TaxID=1912891 RepID=UPI0028BEA163|nr:DUF3363 domain-containing protein [Sphingobium sp.]